MYFQMLTSHRQPVLRVVLFTRDSLILLTEQLHENPQCYDNLADAELVSLCLKTQRVDTQVFAVLVRRYEGVVYRVALRYLGNYADADDAAQDAFLKAFRGLPGFRRDAEFKTWLFKILHNVCMTQFAQRRRNEAIELDEFELASLQENFAADEYQNLIESDAIQNTLAQLNQQDRQILILRLIAELSLQETAETLGLGLSATKMRFYRAQQRFADIYTRIENPSVSGHHYEQKN